MATGEEFSIGTRKVVVAGDYLTDSSHPNYDVAPDGQFVIRSQLGPGASREDWLKKLGARHPT